jgi:hypothetical protein
VGGDREKGEEVGKRPVARRFYNMKYGGTTEILGLLRAVVTKPQIAASILFSLNLAPW